MCINEYKDANSQYGCLSLKVYVHECVCACILTHIYEYTGEYTEVPTRNMDVFMWMYINTNVCVYVCVCIYEYTDANMQYGCLHVDA